MQTSITRNTVTSFAAALLQGSLALALVIFNMLVVVPLVFIAGLFGAVSLTRHARKAQCSSEIIEGDYHVVTKSEQNPDKNAE